MKKLELKINAHLGILGTFSERYVPEGYFDKMDFEKKLEIFSNIKGIEGMGVGYPGHPLIDNPQLVLILLLCLNISSFPNYVIRLNSLWCIFLH